MFSSCQLRARVSTSSVRVRVTRVPMERETSSNLHVFFGHHGLQQCVGFRSVEATVFLHFKAFFAFKHETDESIMWCDCVGDVCVDRVLVPSCVSHVAASFMPHFARRSIRFGGSLRPRRFPRWHDQRSRLLQGLLREVHIDIQVNLQHNNTTIQQLQLSER